MFIYSLFNNKRANKFFPLIKGIRAFIFNNFQLSQTIFSAHLLLKTLIKSLTYPSSGKFITLSIIKF